MGSFIRTNKQQFIPNSNRFSSGFDSVQSREKKNFLVQRVAATIALEHWSLWQLIWHSRGSETSSRSNRESFRRRWRNPERAPLISCSLMESSSSDGQQGLGDVWLSGGRFTCSTGGRKENSVTIIEKNKNQQAAGAASSWASGASSHCSADANLCWCA